MLLAALCRRYAAAVHKRARPPSLAVWSIASHHGQSLRGIDYVAGHVVLDVNFFLEYFCTSGTQCSSGMSSSAGQAVGDGAVRTLDHVDSGTLYRRSM